jgi:signal transduction histidine kinase
VSPQYAAAQHHERYSDEEIFIPERDDKEPARVLRKVFRDGAGQWRELTVMTPTIEKDDLRESILRWMVCLYLFLLLMILLVTVIVLYRTMRPLYALLRWLDGYTVGARNAPLAVETSVTEFRKLNDAARRYAERAESSFERQKQFIGNASHEMQTPLAVCRNRLEMLVDDAHALTGEQLGEFHQLAQSRHGYPADVEALIKFANKLEAGAPIFEADLAQVRACSGRKVRACVPRSRPSSVAS